MSESEIKTPKITDLTAEEFSRLRDARHASAIEIAPGIWKSVQGYSGVIRGCMSSWWLTGELKVEGKKCVFYPDGKAY
jgi:hypothetical protein